MELKELFKKEAASVFTEVLSIRHHLHAHPELSFEEFKTSAFIAATLQNWGIVHTTGICGTGIVGTITGKNPSSKVIALRADIDALPIHEISDKPYKSKNEGVMHACGHDVHSASLLGAIKILHETKSAWEGTVKFIFQPGEEKLPGGASMMIDAGVLKNPAVDGIIGQHVFPELEAGKVGFRPGMYMASADEIYITVHGKGGHAAMPHKNIDPIIIAAEIITSMQQITNHNLESDAPTVLAFGKILGDGATNVIPDDVFLEGTLRTFDEAWRFEIHRRIHNLVNEICASYGATATVDIRVGYPFLTNNEELTQTSIEAAKLYLGPSNVVALPIRMTAEDFAFFSQETKGCFYRLGTASKNGENSIGVHNARFDIDEQALEVGAGLMAWLAVNSLGN